MGASKSSLKIFFVMKTILQQKQNLNLYYHIIQEVNLEAKKFL